MMYTLCWHSVYKNEQIEIESKIKKERRSSSRKRKKAPVVEKTTGTPPTTATWKNDFKFISNDLKPVFIEMMDNKKYIKSINPIAINLK